MSQLQEGMHQVHFREILVDQMKKVRIAGMAIASSHSFELGQRWREENYFDEFNFSLVVDLASPRNDFGADNLFTRLKFADILFLQHVTAGADLPVLFPRLDGYRYRNRSKNLSSYLSGFDGEPMMVSENDSSLWHSNSTEFFHSIKESVQGRQNEPLDGGIAHFILMLGEFGTIEIIATLNASTCVGDSPSSFRSVDFRDQDLEY
ncbi:MAG: hypothetical protein NTY27_02915 [Actinobacteria bacterium]|nr:hypothetical protein [Actinomycetota bacterium]